MRVSGRSCERKSCVFHFERRKGSSSEIWPEAEVFCGECLWMTTTADRQRKDHYLAHDNSDYRGSYYYPVNQYGR